MIGLFSKVFGMASASSLLPLGSKRIIQLGDASLSFSMPENFSKDFPAAPVNELPSDQELASGALLAQRWWDVKEVGWFGKMLGVLMMRVDVHFVLSNERHVLHLISKIKVDTQINFWRQRIL